MAKTPPKSITRLKNENRDLHTKLTRVERLLRIDAAGLSYPRPGLTDIGWRRMRGIQEPEYNPVRLWAYFELDDTLQGVVTKIATESTRKGWEIVPRFAERCTTCGAEYQGAIDECEQCHGVVFIEPNIGGKTMLEAFFKEMNAEVPTDSIIEDTALFSLVLDNWYWWVRSAPNAFDVDVPARVDVLDARFIRAMTDEMGRFVSGEWFCPRCYWTKEGPDSNKVHKGDEYAKAECPAGCGGVLEETAWVQRNRGGQIIGRWSEREIIHGKRFGGSFRLYGLSKVVSLVTMMEALLYQSRYLIGAYRDRRIWDGVLALPMGEARGKQMLKEAQEKWAKDPADPSPLILFMGADMGTPAGEAKWVDLMGKFTDLAPLDFRREYRKAIMADYGVGEVITGAQTAGQLGHPQDALEASYNSIEGLQTHMGETVNRGIIPRFPEPAHDWKWQQIPPKARDEKLDWEVKRLKVEVMKAVNEAHIDKHATIDAEWEVEIEDGPPPPDLQLPTLPPPPGTPPGFPMNLPPTAPPEKLAAPFSDRGKSLQGVKAVEDEYADAVVDVYRQALAGALRDAQDSIQVNIWHEAVNRRFAAARDEALLLSERMVSAIYANALIEESSDLPRARFEQVDAAVLDRIAGPEAFTEYLAGFDREARDAVIAVIVRRFAEPAGLDLKAMVEEMRDATEAAAWRLERIARTETTRVVNEARAAQWMKYADPSAAEYEWLTAEDERVDGRCKEIADRNPWRLEELRLETDGFVPHPNCRCVVIRRPGLNA